MFTSELKYPQYDLKLIHNYKIPSIYDDLNDLNPNAIKSPKPLAKKSEINSQMKMCLRKITCFCKSYIMQSIDRYQTLTILSKLADCLLNLHSTWLLCSFQENARCQFKHGSHNRLYISYLMEKNGSLPVTRPTQCLARWAGGPRYFATSPLRSSRGPPLSVPSPPYAIPMP